MFGIPMSEKLTIFSFQGTVARNLFKFNITVTKNPPGNDKSFAVYDARVAKERDSA
ncbi:hypothetical protein Ple7327_1160 [Pleurocapsa sp. PCC 7327]|nr:hypothetical protein Ple7327_1160 [Pleurocapsa sp. PCC 7327]